MKYDEAFLIGCLVKRHGLTFRYIADYTGAHIHAVSCFHLGAQAGQVVHSRLVELWQSCEVQLKSSYAQENRRPHVARISRRGGTRRNRERASARDWRFREIGTGD